MFLKDTHQLSQKYNKTGKNNSTYYLQKLVNVFWKFTQLLVMPIYKTHKCNLKIRWCL